MEDFEPTYSKKEFTIKMFKFFGLLILLSAITSLPVLFERPKEETKREKIESEMKSVEKQLDELTEQRNHDRIMMKMGVALYKNYLDIYKGNERKADSAYYANDYDLVESVYKESLKIPTK